MCPVGDAPGKTQFAIDDYYLKVKIRAITQLARQMHNKRNAAETGSNDSQLAVFKSETHG
jgi:hypothetical protein